MALRHKQCSWSAGRPRPSSARDTCRDERLRPSGRAKLDRAISALALIAAIALWSGCRLDMHVQPKQNPLSPSDFYPDKRSARPLVESTVARGQLHEDTYFYTGRLGDNPGDVMPFPVTKEVLERGRERFNIYCAPCHSRVGDGNGMIVQRGFKKPPDYTEDKLMKQPVGHF